MTASLPVMMLTGERNAETVMQAMTGGADDYMVKPFDPDTLLERMSRLVKSSAMVWRAVATRARSGSFKQLQRRQRLPAVARNRPAPHPRPGLCAGTGVKP